MSDSLHRIAAYLKDCALPPRARPFYQDAPRRRCSGARLSQRLKRIFGDSETGVCEAPLNCEEERGNKGAQTVGVVSVRGRFRKMRTATEEKGVVYGWSTRTGKCVKAGIRDAHPVTIPTPAMVEKCKS
jgi:hypothetical protein